MSGSTFTLEGRTFAIPTPVVGTADNGERMVAGVAPQREVRQGDDLLTYDMTVEAADLSHVNSGRAPLCYSHMRTLDGLLGALTVAWIEDRSLYFTARIAPVPEADRLWSLLAGGFPISISLGAEVLSADATGTSPLGGQRIAIRQWRLNEISAVLFGANSGAHMVRVASPEGRAMLATRRPIDIAVIRDRLRLDDWQHWSTTAGMRLADKLAVDRDDLCDALATEVSAHAEALLERFA